MPTILMTTPIFPPDVGGPATYVPKLANHLVEHGWDVIVYALSSEIREYCIKNVIMAYSS